MFLRIFFAFIFTSCFLLQVKAQVISEPISGKYIVKFKDSSEPAQEAANELAKKHGAQVEHVYNHAFKGANVTIPPGKEKDLAGDPTVESLTQDFTVSAFIKPDSPSMGGMGGNPTPTPGPTPTPTPVSNQVTPTGIDWIDAELNTTNEGSGVTVAVLDTGIDLDHPDLMVNVALSRDFTTDSTGGDDNNKAGGIKGHGTHVAGVIGALDNNIGVLGVSSQIDLVAVKVLDRTGSGSFGWIIAGLDYVTSNSGVIGVANLSLGAVGGTNPSQGFLDASALLRQAVQRAVNAGVIVVVAAGNESVDVTASNVVPGGYPEVISVSAVDDRNGQQGDDTWAYFSNYGTEVDIIAPGVAILSTAIDGGTSSLSGTSFSAPYVAGTVGLYIARNGRPITGDAQLLGSVLSAISQSRSLLSGEPLDGVTEPACYANGASLQ